MAVPFQKFLPELHKIEPLDGTNYKRWSQKLLLCFEQLETDYVLTTYYSDDSDISQTNTDKFLATPTTPKTPNIPLDETARKKLEKDNKLARSYLLNNMSKTRCLIFLSSLNLLRSYGPNWRRNMVQTTLAKGNML